MRPSGFRLAFLLAAALLVGGCASTETGGGKSDAAPSSGKKSSKATSSGRPKKENLPGQDGDDGVLAKDAVKTNDKTNSAKGLTSEAAKVAAKRKPDSKAVAKPNAKPDAKPDAKAAAKPEARPAEAKVAKQPAQENLSPEAALAKSLAEEKAYDQELRRLYGVSEDARLSDLLSPEETQETARLRARTEAARRRLALSADSRQPVAAGSPPKKLKGLSGDGEAMSASSPTTASLPAIPEASSPSPSKPPTALHLSDWLLDDKTHEAWRAKRLSKLTEAKDVPATEPEKK